MLAPETLNKIRAKLDEATSGANPSIPGLIYAAVGRDGDRLFSHASGSLGLGVNKPMTLDSVFYLASCTKLITGIACMQLVEQGRIGLDSPDDVECIAPELADVKLLSRNADGILELRDKDLRITLRMLLNHTAGFGYAFEDSRYSEWARPVGIQDFSGMVDDVLSRPLVNQPGTKFQYGTSVDWAGVLVERITQISLEQYFRQYILEPLKIRSISFFPDQSMIAKLAFMHQRAPDGSLSIRDHIYRYPLLSTRLAGTDRFCMGGAGCFGQPVELCKIIAMLLNDGTDPASGVQILQPETVKEMFTDQIQNLPRDCNEYTPTAMPELANPCPLVPMPEGLTEGWGLTFSLSHQKTSWGRAAGTASWEGLPNLFWFADRENGIGGIFASQILPYGDLKVIECSETVERLTYNDLLSNMTDRLGDRL